MGTYRKIVPVLYIAPASPPSRAVMTCAKHLNLQFELREIILANGEHRSTQYLKMNPQHTVPTLDDNGFVVVDSHVIMSYMVQQYSNDDSLYPSDVKRRCLIDQRLHFDTGVLWIRYQKIFVDVMMRQRIPIQPDLDLLSEAYGFIENFLEKGNYLAGNSLSIADIAVIATLSSAEIFLKVDPVRFPKTMRWIERMERLPCYEVNRNGLDDLRHLLRGSGLTKIT